MTKLPEQTIDKIVQKYYQGDSLAFLRELEEYVKARPAQAAKQSRNVAGQVLIELKAAARTYKMGRKSVVEAIKGVDLIVREGEIVALTGPSGSGKSTLMHLIAGLDRPTSGEVLVGGKSIGKMSEGDAARYRNRMVGVVFQFFYLQPFLSVTRNVEVPLMFARTSRHTRREPVSRVISSVGLADRASFSPKELSGGQVQRVAIARSLVNEPRILLADEPTGNLDSRNSDAIMKLLASIRDTLGTTMVIVTHDPRVAAWADRVIHIDDGMITI